MSTALKMSTTGSLTPTIDSSSIVKTANNHGLNLTSHINSQHLVQSNIQDVNNSNSSMHISASSANSNICLPIKVSVDNKINSEKTAADKVVTDKVNVDNKLNVENNTKIMEEYKVNIENTTNSSVEKAQITIDTTKPEVVDDKKLSPNINITKVNNTVKPDEIVISEANKTNEVASPIKNNINSAPAVTPPQINTTTEDENNKEVEPVSVKAKEQESPKSSNIVSSTVSSPNEAISSIPTSTTEAAAAPSAPQVATAVPQVAENRVTTKPASTMKLATVSRTHIKRKRDVKTNNKKSLLDESDTEVDGETPQKSKRARVQTQPYQSPLPEFALITKLSASMAKTKASDDKLIIFYKNEFLAVRNSEGGFYVCQAMQNVYKSSPKIRILWLSQDKNDTTGDTYSPDFYDFTDFECIITNLNLNRLDKGLYKLPASELERTKSILQRALNVEQGICSNLDITEEHPDGLDLSLYRDEAQLDNKKKKASKAKRRAEKVKEKAAKKQLNTVSPKSKKIKKSHKKRKANKVTITKVAKSRSNIKRASLNKKETDAIVKPVPSSSRTRAASVLVPVPSTSKVKTTVVSKRKAAVTATKGRTSARNVTVPVATTSRSSRTAKLSKDRRGLK